MKKMKKKMRERKRKLITNRLKPGGKQLILAQSFRSLKSFLSYKGQWPRASLEISLVLGIPKQ